MWLRCFNFNTNNVIEIKNLQRNGSMIWLYRVSVEIWFSHTHHSHSLGISSFWNQWKWAFHDRTAPTVTIWRGSQRFNLFIEKKRQSWQQQSKWSCQYVGRCFRDARQCTPHVDPQIKQIQLRPFCFVVSTPPGLRGTPFVFRLVIAIRREEDKENWQYFLPFPCWLFDEITYDWNYCQTLRYYGSNVINITSIKSGEMYL